MTDAAYTDPRLAALYDPLDPDRSDLEVYAAIVEELGASSLLDVGCGTGTFGCLLAGRGIDVVGIDPARASVDIARAKSLADRVTWLVGDAGDLPSLQVDMATMTANVAQVFLTDSEWLQTLRRLHSVLKPGGHLVFETRDPMRQAWRQWNPDDSLTTVDVDGVGKVAKSHELIDVRGDVVTFRTTVTIMRTGESLASDSTLRFRTQSEIEESLDATGFVVDDVRDAPDRPGRELVFIAST